MSNQTAKEIDFFLKKAIPIFNLFLLRKHSTLVNISTIKTSRKNCYNVIYNIKWNCVKSNIGQIKGIWLQDSRIIISIQTIKKQT